MKKATTKNFSGIAPKPVQPTSIRQHGLLGITNIRQHMIVDERWTTSSITEEFQAMTQLLKRRNTSEKFQYATHQKRCLTAFRSLHRQCRDGRTKLQMILHGNNSRLIRNYTMEHKEMQRLYQKMPIQEVARSMNQRTFVMRKEKDRLQHSLKQLKEVYYSNLMERARLENRLKLQSDYALEEQKKSQEFRKLLTDSSVRLKANTNINLTYKQLIQILRNDSNFYEPILRSLSEDIEQQANFIKNILYMGGKAIMMYRQLGDEYRLIDERYKKNIQATMSNVKIDRKSLEIRKSAANKDKANEIVVPQRLAHRYARETEGMIHLKKELEIKSNAIKKVEFATLCSSSKQIVSRMKSQVENNVKLHRTIEEETLTRKNIETKMKLSKVLEGVLTNNMDEEEQERLDRIRSLQEEISEQGHRKAKILAHMKDRANAYVVLRLSLWNLADILRHVDSYALVKKIPYPASYLELPLLQFDMLPMNAIPPQPYEADVALIVRQLKRKVFKLMRGYEERKLTQTLEAYVDEYGDEFLESCDLEDFSGSDDVMKGNKEDEELLEARLNATVPNRLQMKAASAKLVEEMAKRIE